MLITSLVIIGVTLTSGGLGSGAGGVAAGFGIGLLEAVPLLGPIVSGLVLMNGNLGGWLSTAFFVMAGVQAFGLAVMALSQLSPAAKVDVATLHGASGAPKLKVQVAAGASGANVSLLF